MNIHIPKSIIPKIIHQIWLQGQAELPKHHIPWQNSIIKYNPNYKYKLWDDSMIRNLIQVYDDELYKIYCNSKHIVQKADIARYVILEKFGGFYIDMDCECFRSLDPLLDNCQNGLFIADDGQIPFSTMNGMIGSSPNHPIYTYIFDLIKKRTKSIFAYFPYKSFVIMWVAGPTMFRNAIDQWYNDSGLKPTYYNNDIIHIYNPCTSGSCTDYKSSYKNCYLMHHSQYTERDLEKIYTKPQFYIPSIIISLIILTMLIIYFFQKK